MGRLSLVATILLLAEAHSFCPGLSVWSRNSKLNMVPTDAPAGTFFHQVPDDNDNDSDKTSQDEPLVDFDDAVTKLLRQRRKKPLAYEPSTIKGVPTSKATGFGKNQAGKKPKKPFVAIGPQDDPPLNDPTKPEFDDQGYTLYTDSETGKKSRVFEALLDYPCDFTMKIVGVNEGTFVEEMVAVVAEACDIGPEKISYSFKIMGKWTSVTVQAPVKSSEMLYSLYEKVDLDPRVKFKF